MKLKKLVAMGLAVLMTMSVIAGCGKEEVSTSNSTESVHNSEQISNSEMVVSTDEKNEIVFPLKETMDLTGLSIMCNTYNMKDNLAWKALLERGNINIELTEIAPKEMKEKGALIMAGGDYPEILFKCSALDLDKYGMEGILIPLEDLIREYAPNLTALLDERGAWNQVASPDGHIYALPGVDKSNLNGASSYCWWINQKWMDNLGLKEPKNQEELYNVLKAFKEQDANGNGDTNDEIPLTFDKAGLKHFISWQDGVLHYYNYFAVVDDKFTFYPLTEGFKENYLQYFSKMYDEGILDQNGYTQTEEQLKAIAQSGDVYGMYCGSGTAVVQEEHRLDYVTLNSFNEEGLPLNTGIAREGLAITDKCKNPEVIVAWADYLYTQEGGRYARLGIEDLTYKVNSDGTYLPLADHGLESYIYQATLMGSATVPCLIPDLYYNVSPDANPITKHAQDQMFGEEGVFGVENGVIMPYLNLTEAENEIASTLATDINGYIDNYSAQVITGQLSLEDSWQEFQDTLKKMKVEELISIYTAAYERAISE